MNIKTIPTILTMPIDKEMAEAILNALSIADHESMGLGDEVTSRIIRVIKVLFPDVVEKYSYLERD